MVRRWTKGTTEAKLWRGGGGGQECNESGEAGAPRAAANFDHQTFLSPFGSPPIQSGLARPLEQLAVGPLARTAHTAHAHTPAPHKNLVWVGPHAPAPLPTMRLRHPSLCCSAPPLPDAVVPVIAVTHASAALLQALQQPARRAHAGQWGVGVGAGHKGRGGRHS